MELLFGFLSGMFLTNGIPHLVAGINGQTHMTPFAKNSSALVNVIWAYANFIGGIWIFSLTAMALSDIFILDMFGISFWVGSLFMALSAAWLFGNKKARFPWFKEEQTQV